LTATATAEPHTWFATGTNSLCASASTFKYSLMPPKPHTSGWAMSTQPARSKSRQPHLVNSASPPAMLMRNLPRNKR